MHKSKDPTTARHWEMQADLHCQEFVENWVMAARRQHPMMVAWKALFNGHLHAR